MHSLLSFMPLYNADQWPTRGLSPHAGPAPGTQPQAAGTEGQQVTAQGSGSESDLQRSDTLEAEQPFHMLDLQVAALGGVESTAEESKAEELEGPVS